MLSIIIPTLNCRASLTRTLKDIEVRPPEWEVIVCDGGSTDGTPEAAELMKARVVRAERGRGTQLAAGAKAANKSWYLFLHADTQPQPGWPSIVEPFMKDPNNLFRAAYFRLVLNDPSPSARRVERLANWRARTFGLPYGDQGLLISAEYYAHLGGYKPFPLMEDVDLANRIGARRLEMLDTAAVTSAVRYQRQGWWSRPLKNLCLLGLFLVGTSPHTLARWYR